jgi:Winged helix DNA-binding domain
VRSWQDRTVRVFTATERRARLARRHHLAAETPAPDAVALASRLVGLHASDPPSVFLGARARIPDFVPADLEEAMYDLGALRKHLAMRRTLFVFPTELVAVVQAACTNAVLAAERKRLVKDVEQHGIAADGARWLARAERATLKALAQGDATGAELSKAVPALRAKISIGEGRSWAADVGMTGRVLTVLSAAGRIVRGRPTGSWTSSRHRWALAADGSIPAMREADARIELVRRWLWSFGPATLTDLTWWTGLGVTKIRPALAALGVAEVDLEGEPGVVLPDDLDPTPSVAPWAAFLPTLDPTTMGWKLRDWYLGEYGPALFDTSGNAGPTIWWDGRVVGGWVQRPSGEVVYRLLEDVGADASAAVEREAARLQDWLGTTLVTPRFPSPVGRALRS